MNQQRLVAVQSGIFSSQVFSFQRICIIIAVKEKLIAMKQLFVIAFVLFCSTLSAQPKLSALKTSASIKPSIQKVAQDYFHDFNNTRGELVFENNNAVQFTSKIVPPGALHVVITQYKLPKSFTWQAIMLQTDNFKEAESRYRQYFRQLDGATFNLDGTVYKISGVYDAPDENRSFASSTLEVKGDTENLKLLRVEIGINFAFPEWSVQILIYERIGDKDVRPDFSGSN
jgi:hypothetical protein